MSSFFTRPGRIAADLYEARIEETILSAEDLYGLDGETFFRRRDGRIETGSFDAFEQEAF